MKWFVVGIVILVGAIIAMLPLVTRTQAATVVSSSAQAWIWVAPGEQEHFVAELGQYARDEGLKFSTRKIPGPSWEITEAVLLTPRGNRVRVANATAADKFNAAIFASHPEENWQDYWKGFRAYVGARHRWEDVP